MLSAIGERQAAFDALSQEFGRLIDDVDARGVVLRDLEEGLVDFPARARGMPIFLCWRVGEPRITFWHGVTEGFAGRKPIWTIPDPSGRPPA
ncbi:MAG: DUF2203 domain-containing protein [Armatimonadetes bacterium]|nr:DUF2203 domain-containing protein [Armatimonadota bacterium]